MRRLGTYKVIFVHMLSSHSVVPYRPWFITGSGYGPLSSLVYHCTRLWSVFVPLLRPSHGCTSRLCHPPVTRWTSSLSALETPGHHNSIKVLNCFHRNLLPWTQFFTKRKAIETDKPDPFNISYWRR